MKTFLLLAIALCAQALDIKMEAMEPMESAPEPQIQKEKRQTQDDLVHTHLLYRPSRKQEHVAPVEEIQEDDKNGGSRADNDEYRPGQVFSLNAQELLDLQPERKAPLPSSQQLQQLYSNPQPEHKQNLQQFYYIEPQSGRQVSLHPSHTVIARPHYSNGGEASVGAALSVSDNGVSPSHSFDQDLLALLGHSSRQEEARQQSYSHAQQATPVTTQSIAPTYQQVDRYITKPSKKPTKLRSKVQINPPQLPSAPQQYLIETTNVQQQQQQQATHQQQYHTAPQPQRAQLRYVPIQQQIAIQQYDGPETQGLKVVPPPKLQPVQQPHQQLAYRIQYQQAEAAPKQYRIVEAPRIQQQQHRQEQGRSVASERPVTYLKRFPEPEKVRAVKIYDQAISEGSVQQQANVGEQYYLRPVYKTAEPHNRYELQQFARIDPTKPPLSAIYVSKNVVPKKVLRPVVRVDQAKLEQQHREQAYRIAPSNVAQANYDQHGQNSEEQREQREQRPQLPPPRNNKAYTPEEFAALVAAGYSVTPVPVSSTNHQVAQSRSSVEPAPQRRLFYSRRHQYLPLRSDEAP